MPTPLAAEARCGLRVECHNLESKRRPAMANPVKPIPKGYHTITPSLICKNAAQAIEFYKKALGAVERSRMSMPDGKIGHAELKIGNSIFFIADEFPGMGAVAPTSMGAFYL